MNKLYLIVRSAKRSVWQLFTLPQKIQNFGLNFAVRDVLLNIALKWTNSYSVYETLHQLIFGYFESKYPDFIKRLKSERLTFSDEKVKIIWVMWWQNFSNAPEIVKGCQKKLQEFCPNYKIIQINKENYRQYADIPDYIIRKVQEGKISLTHLSDILRVDLLARHGGLWIDSTVLLTHGLEELILEYPFYSIKGKMVSNHSVSKYRFATFFMYSKQGNSYFEFVRDLLFQYWKDHDYHICYLIIDYCMLIATKYNKDYEKMLEEVPYSNPMLHELRENFNTEYSDDLWKKLMNDTYVYKLSYKFKTLNKTASGKDTVWSHIKACLLQ